MNQFLKRSFDVFVSGLVILVALPLWFLVAILIKLESPGPVFYRGSRVGKDGNEFKIYKFRSMVNLADQTGIGITQRDDQRITRIGHVLRNLKIDEMPQLLNVLKGEMSIVGPRPEDPKFVEYYTPEQREVLKFRPGMASPAFIKFRNEETILAQENAEDLEQIYISEIMPKKLEMDLDYIAKQTFLYDLRILFSAALSLFNLFGTKGEIN